jgi:hypothetical protein
MSDLTPQTSAITFRWLREVPARDEVIRIDAKGFHYLGQFIADAGEAYQLLVEFLRKQRQAPQPVSVHERLPGPEDCDAEGRCWVYVLLEAWAGEPEFFIWELKRVKYASANYGASHWLPAHALPLPEVNNG